MAFLDAWDCVRPHNRHAMECPREIRAVRRAFLLPSGERADGPHGAGSVGAQHPAAWRASSPFVAEEADLCAKQRGLQLRYRGWFSGLPELKDESEASKDEQADSAKENNVGNDELFVIGLYRSGDAIALFLQDWEAAKVALSCHIALDMLCQELHDVERRRGWFGF